MARARRGPVRRLVGEGRERPVSWLTDAFSGSFGQRALLEAVMVGIVCGVIGVHVLLRRLPFFTLAMGHATFPGVVLAALAGVNLLFGAGAFGVLVVVAIGLLGARDRIDDTSAIGVVLAGTFALGVLLLSAQQGFTKDLSACLIGSIVTVQPSDLYITAGAAAVVLGVLAGLHKELVLGAFDRDGLAALGYPAVALDLVVLLLIEVVVVTSVPAVGTILSVALITAPAATARLWTDRLGPTMALSAVLGAASGAIGLVLSRHWDIAAGATIVLVAGGLFAVSVVASPRHGAVRQLLVRRRPGLAA
jgi:ABC-type Mn2+/Zn2+ transport system permease subunit